MDDNPSRDINIIKQIDAYLKGKLSAREAEQLWITLLKNPEYLEYLETEISLKTILEEEEEAGAVGEATVSAFKRSWRWLAAAASVTLLIVAVNFFMADTQQSVQELALSEITIADNLAAPQVFRSQKSSLTNADSLLNLGFEAALSGNLNKAVQIYESVIRQFESDPATSQAHLNIGIIRYNRGDYQPATTAFKQAISQVKDDAVLEEKAYWYLGNAYINMERLQEAREAIQQTYSMDGIYRKPAFRLLRKLDYELGNIDLEEFEQKMEEN